MAVFSWPFGRSQRQPLESLADAMTSIFVGKRPAPPTSNIAGTDLENMLKSAILRQDQQAYEEVYSAIFAIALSRPQRDLIAKLAPQDKELREIGIPSALARLLFSAFRTGARWSESATLQSGLNALEAELNALATSSLFARHIEASARIHEYFINASTVFAATDHAPARMAALCAAAVSDHDLRAQQVTELGDFTLALIGNGDRSLAIVKLADEIKAGAWTMDDIRHLKGELRSLDGELADCLDDSDPTVFRRRWPNAFLYRVRNQTDVTP
jgi:hypothetical protein